MTNQINSYKELLQEKARLKALLAEQEVLIKEDWQAIKHDLQPAVLVGSTLRKLLTRKGGITAAHLGINLLADGFVKKVLLGRTKWLIRWLVPFLIKNYASHLVDEPGSWLHKIKTMFGKNGKMHQETGMDAV
ncbi:hypothetical protein FAM09_19530 [Niastella caeni]|uniref:Uncharacterized protein n=1 Tax=Niastella caeni TaxID=2569763 RepID=A0A4S8HPA8_9BACT|nr:hypothetical protein [Niastella caeni]THU37143.1 hypothetical protein FAM09_19530 [Niastella caeni]